MARSALNDTLEKFRFGVSWYSGDPITVDINGVPTTFLGNVNKAGFHDVQMPKRATNKIQYREGNDPDILSVSAGLTSMEDIVLSRGMMPYGQHTEMFDWSHAVHAAGDTTSNLSYATDKVRGNTASNDYRKEVWIWMYHRDGSIARAWKLFNAFPVAFTPGSDLNSQEDGEKSLESLTLAYEDFIELDTSADDFALPADETPPTPSNG